MGREEISTMGKKAQKPRALEVEIIYGKRIKNGHTEYWIKWKGFPEKDSTWENVTNIEDKNAGKMIKAFEAKTKADEKAAKGASDKKKTPAKTAADKKKTPAKAAAEKKKTPAKAAPKGWYPALGDKIEVAEDDCWWESQVTKEEKSKNKVKVMLRVSDEEKFFKIKDARPCAWDTSSTPAKAKRK